MGIHEKIEAVPEPRYYFDASAAYEAEREANRNLWECLSKVLLITGAMIDEAERRGEDVTVRRAIFDAAREQRWAGA